MDSEAMFDLMKKESNRLKTFQMNPPWPKEYIDIKKLAKAGFFYAFNGDHVYCAFCRGQVFRWEPNDDPMTEHAKHFTTCPFILGGDVGNEPLGEDPFPGPKRPRPYDVCGGAFHDHQTIHERTIHEPSNLTSICKICYSNSIELVFLPCGHSLSCLSCSQRLFTCPCCRTTITTRIRTYIV